VRQLGKCRNCLPFLDLKRGEELGVLVLVPVRLSGMFFKKLTARSSSNSDLIKENKYFGGSLVVEARVPSIVNLE
jgi:hypothetical protein